MRCAYMVTDPANKLLDIPRTRVPDCTGDGGGGWYGHGALRGGG